MNTKLFFLLMMCSISLLTAQTTDFNADGTYKDGSTALNSLNYNFATWNLSQLGANSATLYQFAEAPFACVQMRTQAGITLDGFATPATTAGGLRLFTTGAYLYFPKLASITKLGIKAFVTKSGATDRTGPMTLQFYNNGVWSDIQALTVNCDGTINTFTVNVNKSNVQLRIALSSVYTINITEVSTPDAQSTAINNLNYLDDNAIIAGTKLMLLKSDLNVSLFNLTGRLIRNYKNANNSIDLPTTKCIIKIVSKDGVQVIKYLG